MNQFYLSAIYVYPIKSLGGINLEASVIEEKGLRHDRRWLLIDEQGMFITQRKYPSLALLQVDIRGEEIIVFNKTAPENSISFAADQPNGQVIPVTIWDDLTEGIEVDKNVSEWFSNYMEMPLRLVYMPEQAKRKVDPRYAKNAEIVSFADGYPCLLIGEQSLDYLNSKLEKPVLMDRFRPNLVFKGGEAHVEDSFEDFEIGQVTFSAVKPCARCVLITVDQQTAVKGQEPLKTLSKYRLQNNNVMFGQNLIHHGTGEIKVGMELKLKSSKRQAG